MSALKKILESSVRVQYQDCDPFHHLNNSKYIDYIMAARTEQLLENYQLNVAEIARTKGVGWVSAQTQISYLYPSVWLETVIVETRLIAFSESSLLVEAIMRNEDKTHIKAVMWAKLVHFDIRTQRSARHTAELMHFFTQVHFPIGEIPVFEERVKTLKSNNLS